MFFLDCFYEICLWLREVEICFLGLDNSGKTRLLLMHRDEGKPMVDNGNGRDRGFEDISDDLLIDILMRLPAEQLWRSCRRVCTRWKALISSPCFRQLHLQQAPSTFFVHFFRKASEKMKFFFPRDDDVKASPLKNWVFDGSLVKSWKRIENSYKEVYPVNSCNGLVLFETHSRDKMYIGNPITGGLMTITKAYAGGGLFGFFDHPKKKQYMVLLSRQNLDRDGEYPYENLIYVIGCSIWRNLGEHPFRVRKQAPVIVNNTLYWMIADKFGQYCEESILKFSMDSERFCTLPHPSGQCQPTQRLSRHEKIDLLEMDGRLACICSWGIVSTLWVLEFRDGYRPYNCFVYWSPLYSLDFGLFPFSNVHAYDDSEIQFVSIQNMELLLVWQRRGAFRYNLLTDAVTEVELDIGKF